MAKITVKLRIVGLYFNEPVEITDRPGLTVKDVMDEYIRLNPNLHVAGGLEYHVGKKYGNMETIAYNFNGRYNFNGVQNPRTSGKTLKGEHRSPGIYRLSETLLSTPQVELGWQYYVMSARGKNKSKTKSSGGFKNFNDPNPDYNIQNGDTIIWRLVAIAMATSPH
jgi:hypothetical protein